MDLEDQDRTAGAQTSPEGPEAWGWTRSRSQVNDSQPPGRVARAGPSGGWEVNSCLKK